MYTNSLAQLSYAIVRSTAFDVTSANVVVTPPTGVAEPSSGATVSPAGASTTQTLQYDYNPQVGGQHRLLWDYTVDGVVKYAKQSFWVTWEPVYSRVRTLLSLSEAALSDETLGYYYSALAIAILGQFPSLGEYHELDAEKASIFDQGVAWLLAAELRPTVPKSSPVGELTMIRKGTTTFQYANPYAWRRSELPTVEGSWVKLGWGILASLAEVAAALEQQDQDAHSMIPTRATYSGVDEHAESSC